MQWFLIRDCLSRFEMRKIISNRPMQWFLVMENKEEEFVSVKLSVNMKFDVHDHFFLDGRGNCDDYEQMIFE